MVALSAPMLEKILREHFTVLHVSVEDQTKQHAGHRGAMQGSGHFKVTLVAEEFAGKGRLEQHRMIYSLLQPYFGQSLHALAMHTFSPSEWEKSHD